MSVFKQDYRAYTGRTTPQWQRIVVLVRYALAEAWSSKITVGLFTFALLPILVNLILIYLANNPLAKLLVMRNGTLSIDASFFFRLIETQSWLALVLNAWIAPRMISFDLADNALPILLSHPISRLRYLLGKYLALFSLLSLVSWMPCLLLFVYQGYTSAQPWTMQHLQIASGLLLGSVVWICLLCFLGLALSSWVKWRAVATGIIFGAVFVPAGIGGIASAILRTRWGLLLNLPVLMSQLWQRLLGAPEIMPPSRAIPTPAISIVLALICFTCIAMLNARIRAREVVRG